MITEGLLKYDIGAGADAFTSGRDGILPCNIITGHQVHGARIALIDSPDLTREDLEGYDAFVTAIPGCAVGVRTADCVPVLMYDPVKRVVAAVHSGWRGTVLRISQKTVRYLQEYFGTVPSDVRAVIGPAIGPDSFQVGEEVVKEFSDNGFPMQSIWSVSNAIPGKPMSGGHHIDLFEANRWLLEDSGLMPQNIQIAGIDTYTDPSLFSARREGTHCGRNINAIRLTPPPSSF